MFGKFFLCLYLLLSSALVFAQSTSGRIEGTITDSSGAVAPGATVLLTGTDTAREWQTESNELGYYTFPLVPPGRYQLLVEKTGFQKVSRTKITLAGVY